MSNESYIISVYNTVTGQFEDIEVCEDIYNGYRRSGWAIKRNNGRFRENEITFSDLKGGMDGAYENFDEFRSDQNNPALLVAEELTLQDLRQALINLTDDERRLHQAIFLEGKSERQTAAELDWPYMTVHDRKIRLLRKLKKLLEK